MDDGASIKTEFEKATGNLKRACGDLDGNLVVLATNRKELEALKRLGGRKYIEFDIGKIKAPQRIGDVHVILKRVDLERQKFTIELLADDRRVEKKDRNINEPIQFYVSKVRQPYEIVVNEIKDNQIVGYLAIAKSPVLE